MIDTRSPMITVHTDTGPLALLEHSSLADALSLWLTVTGQSEANVATAVNGEFVAKADRAQYRLSNGDTVLCFSPITGG